MGALSKGVWGVGGSLLLHTPPRGGMGGMYPLDLYVGQGWTACCRLKATGSASLLAAGGAGPRLCSGWAKLHGVGGGAIGRGGYSGPLVTSSMMLKNLFKNVFRHLENLFLLSQASFIWRGGEMLQ